MKLTTQRGTSLVAVLVGGVVVSIMIAALTKSLMQSQKGMDRISQMGDADLLRHLLITGIDCTGTFATGAASPKDPTTAADCGSTSLLQKAPYFRLRRKTLDGSVQYFTPPLEADDSAPLGKLLIKASCSKDEQTMVIRALADPGQGKARDWTQAKLLFGSAKGSLPLCFTTTLATSTNYPWANSACSFDVNNDGYVSPIDALQIINEINKNGEHALDTPISKPPPPPYYDAVRNNYVDRGDASAIIDCLNSHVAPCDGNPCNIPPSLEWTNSKCALDTNNDGFISAIDALQVINEINTRPPHRLDLDTSAPVAPNPEHRVSTTNGLVTYFKHTAPPPYVDTNADRHVDEKDALAVINYLNMTGPGKCP